MRPTNALDRDMDACRGNHLLVILAVFICVYFVFRDFGIRMIFGWAVMLAVAGSYFVSSVAGNMPLYLQREKLWFLFLAAAVFVFLCSPEARHDEDTQAYIIALFISLLFLLFALPSFREVRRAEKIIVAAALVFSAAILLCRIFPNLYFSTIYKVLSVETRTMADELVKQGYGIPIGGSTVYADYVIMAAAVSTFVFVNGRSTRRQKAVGLLMVLFFLAAVLAGGRRGELLSLVVTLVFLFLFSKNHTRFLKRLLVFLAVGALLATLFFVFYDQIIRLPFLARYALTSTRLQSGQDITSGRLELWRTAGDLFKSSPVFGIGFGGFADHVPETFKAVHGEVGNVHNMILQFLCETGLVGTALLLIPQIGLFCLTYRRTLRIMNGAVPSRARDEAAKMGQISLGIQVFFFVLDMLDPCFFKLLFWCFYAFAVILTGASWRLWKKENEILRAEVCREGVSAPRPLPRRGTVGGVKR